MIELMLEGVSWVVTGALMAHICYRAGLRDGKLEGWSRGFKRGYIFGLVKYGPLSELPSTPGEIVSAHASSASITFMDRRTGPVS